MATMEEGKRETPVSADVDSASGGASMDVGTQQQLFIDDRFVESPDGVKLCMNVPVQHPEPVLTADSPWEPLGVAYYNTVLLEPDGRFRLWYGAMMKHGLPQEGAIRLCYAESDDGLKWRKPSLGFVTFQGSKDNNIVAPLQERQSMQGATVYRDERAPEAERYKLWSKFRPTDEQMAAGVRPGLWAMHSPDGVRWSEYPGQPNPPDQKCDTQNMFFWDDSVGQYVGYTRVRETQMADEAAEAGRKGRYRSVGRITSPDFRTWSQTEIVFEADDKDLTIPVPEQRDDPSPNIDFYTNCAMKYPYAQDVYLMFPSAFYHWGENDYPATMDVQFLISRNGVSWRRAGERGPFLRRGPDGSPSGSMVFANPWLVPVKDELWLYYTAMGRPHSETPRGPEESGIYRASMRRDGFVSIDAGYGGGGFRTPVIRFEGNCLQLNVDGSAGGWLKVEVQDADGSTVAGLGLNDADAVTGNSVRRTVSWKGRTDLAAVAGRPVRLRFVMRDIKLYAFRFRS